MNKNQSELPRVNLVFMADSNYSCTWQQIPVDPACRMLFSLTVARYNRYAMLEPITFPFWSQIRYSRRWKSPWSVCMIFFSFHAQRCNLVQLEGLSTGSEKCQVVACQDIAERMFWNNGDLVTLSDEFKVGFGFPSVTVRRLELFNALVPLAMARISLPVFRDGMSSHDSALQFLWLQLGFQGTIILLPSSLIHSLSWKTDVFQLEEWDYST